MTASELTNRRRKAASYVFGVCLVPWVILNAKDLEHAKLLTELFVPVLGVIAAFFYVGIDMGRANWDREQDAYVGKQIRETVISMLPEDLRVTEQERALLAKREILKKLTGVFWETVDANEPLRAYKEHFYSNGFLYSLSIDIYLIGVFFSLLYSITSLLSRRVEFAYVAAGCVVIALSSRVLVTPARRKTHLQLSTEQLSILKRDYSKTVQDKLRAIVIGWRGTHA